MRYIIQFLFTAGVIYFVAQSGYVTGIESQNGYISILVFSILLGIVNLILGTALRIITFPLRLITLGAFSFAISLFLVKVTDELIPNVTLVGFWPVVAIALITGTISIIFKLMR